MRFQIGNLVIMKKTDRTFTNQREDLNQYYKCKHEIANLNPGNKTNKLETNTTARSSRLEIPSL